MILSMVFVFVPRASASAARIQEERTVLVRNACVKSCLVFWGNPSATLLSGCGFPHPIYDRIS